MAVERLGRRRSGMVCLELISGSSKTNRIPLKDSFEPSLIGFVGAVATNFSVRSSASGTAGINVNLQRADRDKVNRIVWSQRGRLLFGAGFRLETGEIRERDLSTVDTAGGANSRAFTTQVERRTIGVILIVRDDFDGARWRLDIDLSASTDRGGERLFKVHNRPVVSWGQWQDVAEMGRDEAEQVVRALPGG